jgi:threonylcarbamoyladenosine tRNA methylthiotransferase MtaB
MSFAKTADFLMMHVFAYSKRKGTLAAEMKDQIPTAIKKQRSAALIALGVELRRGRLVRALERRPVCEVLFETYENGLAIGHTDSFLEVAVPTPVALHSEIHTVKLTEIEGSRLLGVLQ